MHPNSQKEQFSIAYVHALASVAGLQLVRIVVDDDSVDVQLGRSGNRSPQLGIQLKCSSELALGAEDFPLRLKLKNYEDLRRATMVPRILAVVHVPHSVADWMAEEPDQIVLRHRAYWLNLLGEPAHAATKATDWQQMKVTVRVPRGNLLTAARLRGMMDNIEQTDAI